MKSNSICLNFLKYDKCYYQSYLEIITYSSVKKRYRDKIGIYICLIARNAFNLDNKRRLIINITIRLDWV
jgi:hypothetical protein